VKHIQEIERSLSNIPLQSHIPKINDPETRLENMEGYMQTTQIKTKQGS